MRRSVQGERGENGGLGPRGSRGDCGQKGDPGKKGTLGEGVSNRCSCMYSVTEANSAVTQC